MGIVMDNDALIVRLVGIFTHILHMLVYIGNIAIIVCQTFEQHLNNVNEVLNIMCKLEMQVNPAKCI